MAAEDVLQKLLDRVGNDVEAAREELARAVEGERAEAAVLAREAAEADRAQAIAQAAVAAEERGHVAGRDAGYRAGFDVGRGAGFEEGKKDGYDTGFSAGREEGLRVGHLAGEAAGREAGRQEGFASGRDAGLVEGRREAEAVIQPSDAGASQRVIDAFRAIDAARTLTDILDTLINNVAQEASRAALLLVRGSKLQSWRHAGFGNLPHDAELPIAQSRVVADARQSGSTASADHAMAVPIRLAGEVIAVLYADAAGSHPAQPAWPASIEALTRYAARSLEAMTAFRTAKMLSGPAPGPTPREPVDDEQAARRYARLLVSEIRMYHEAEVMVGRRERDLGARLGGEIAHARVLYEQRVPARVRRGADHFHAELVRTLADGDASLLKS